MKKILWFVFICLFSVTLINAEEKSESKTSDVTPNAQSSILIEASTGKVLYEKDADKKLAPASMTKVMTMLLLMEAIDDGKIKMNDKVLISKNAASMGGSQIFIEENSKVTINELLKGIGIASANDVVVTKKQSQIIREEIII